MRSLLETKLAKVEMLASGTSIPYIFDWTL